MKPGAISESDALISAIKSVIEGKAKDIQEQEIKSAVEMFERRLRDAVGTTAINVANFYSVYRNGNDLVITVRIEDQK